MAGVLTVKIVGESRDAVAAIDHVEGKLGRLSGVASGVGRAVAGAAVAATAGVIAAGAFAVSSIKSASDLGETVSKSNVIFGQQAAAQLMGLADGASTALGLSERAYLDYASGYGNMLVGIGGLTQEAAAKQAAELTTLTADIASFNNATTDEVSTAVTSALTGEFEPLKKYGVVINDATLKAKALELGLLDSNGAMSTQAKQAATLALVYEQTATAQGDFAETSGGAANQSKILAAQFENLKSDLGQKLLPVAVKALTFLNDIFPKIAAVAGPAIDAIVGGVRSFVDAFKGDSSGTGGIQQFGTTARDVFERVQEVVGRVFDWLKNVGLPAAKQFITDAVAAFQDAWPKIQEAMKIIQDVVAQVFDFLVTVALPAAKQFIGEAIAAFQEAWPKIQEAMVNIQTIVADVITIVTTLWNKFGEDILAYVRIAFDTLVTVIGGALEIVSGIIAVFTGILTGDWGKAWDGIKSIVSGAVDIVKGLVSGAFGQLAVIIGALLDEAKTSVTNKFDSIVDFITGLPGRIASAASGMFDGIKDAFRSAINWIIGKWNGLSFTIGGGSFMGADIPSASFGTPDIQRLHSGGIVSGRYGEEVLTLLLAGETVRTSEQEAALNRRSGIVIENLYMTERPLLEELTELEARYGMLV